MLRKRRLFGCACCRQIWDLIADERCRDAVEISERFAEGRATQKALDRARQRAFIAVEKYDERHLPEDMVIGDHPGSCAVRAAAHAAFSDDATGQVYNPWKKLELVGYYSHRAARDDFAADLLRDVIGNPFRAARLRGDWREWRNGALVTLVRSMCDSVDEAQMQELANLLEEFGCTDDAILNHCRQPLPHAKGCWVVELILGS